MSLFRVCRSLYKRPSQSARLVLADHCLLAFAHFKMESHFVLILACMSAIGRFGEICVDLTYFLVSLFTDIFLFVHYFIFVVI